MQHKRWRGEKADRFKAIQRKSILKRQFGITPDQYAAMLKAQNGKCAVCGDVQNGKGLAVDHDHKTKKVRGLLCFRCNRAIGLLRDSTKIAGQLAAYLRGQTHG